MYLLYAMLVVSAHLFVQEGLPGQRLDFSVLCYGILISPTYTHALRTLVFFIQYQI